MRRLPLNCGSRMVAGSVFTKILAVEGMRLEEQERPLPAQAVQLHQQLVRSAAPNSASAGSSPEPRAPRRQRLVAQHRCGS